MTTAQVAKLSGATARQIQWWAETGYLTVRQEAHARVWDHETVEALMLMVDARKRGCPLRLARTMVRCLAKSPEAVWMAASRGRINFLATAPALLDWLATQESAVTVVRIRRAPDPLPESPRHLVRPRRLISRRVSDGAGAPKLSPSQVFNELLRARA
jgi:DNA-binding transcriptional MerR regulator